MIKILAAATFVLCAVAANVLTSVFHMVPLFGGLQVAAGTFAAGLVLLARDAVQEYGGRWWVLACVAAGTAASVALAGPKLALASGAAFAVSEFVDTAVYTPLRRRGWGRAAFASGVAGSIVDTLIFLTLAGFGLTWGSVSGQLIVKIGLTALVVGMASALLRYRLRTKGA